MIEKIRALLDPDKQNGAAWDLLTALRGPDNGDWPLKERTTLRIRYVLMPACKPSDFPQPDQPVIGESRMIFRDRLIKKLQEEFPDQRHFLFHYADACYSYWQLKEAAR